MKKPEFKRVHYNWKGNGVGRVIEFKGVWRRQNEWAEIYGVQSDTIRKRMRQGVPIDVGGRAVYIVGGPFDGSYMTRSEIGRRVYASSAWVGEKSKGNVFVWQEPQRVKQVSRPSEHSTAKDAANGDEVVFPAAGEECHHLAAMFAKLPRAGYGSVA